VDGARWYLAQDMFYSQSVLLYAFAKEWGRQRRRTRGRTTRGTPTGPTGCGSWCGVRAAHHLWKGGMGTMGISAPEV